MKISRENFNMMRPKQIYQLPILTLSFNNKQDLRDIITDYVLHHIEEQSKAHPIKKFKSKFIKYPSITLKVNINKEQRQINCDFVMILSKYIEFEKKNIYRQDRIQPLVVDILNFLDEIEQKTKDIIFQIDPSNKMKKIQQEVLNLIIQKHHKDKQKKCHTVQIDHYKKRIIAKHTRVSYIDIQDQLKKKQKQFLLQISDIGSLTFRNESKVQRNIIIPNNSSNVTDKLLELIENGQIFENPDKVQQLKKQKLLQFYQSNQIQYLSKKAQILQDLPEFDNNSFTPECLQMLKNWVIDISLTQKYCQQKYLKSQKKKAHNIDFNEQLLDQPII